MADVESNIHVNIDTSDALASLKLLQRQISAFHTQMAKSGTAASAVAANQAQNLMNSINATGQFQASMRTVTTSTEAFTQSLEKNKLTSREYFRYTGAATKTFGRLFRSEFETLNKVARERVKDVQTQYIKMGRGANGALQAIAVRPLTLDMKNLGTQTAIAAQRQQLLNQLLKQGSTNLLNFGKNTQWAGRQLMVGFTVPLVMLGTQAAKTFMALEEQAIRFKRVYGEMFTTQDETDKMVKNIQLLAKEYTKYGVAVEKTMEMAANAAAMGKMGADLIAQVSEATRLAVLGGVEQEQALETTISVTNAFGVATEDLANKIDFLNAVENQTVVSIEDLTIAIPKAGPVVQQLGGDVEDLAFFLTAMKEGGINASEGANALKSGLASLINPSDKASKMLMGLGINIKGIVEANAGDVTSTVVSFAKALDTLDPLNRARAIEQLFGKFQFSRLSTLFQNVTKEGTQASRVLKLAQATTEELAILSERELSRVEESTTYKFKKSIEDLKVSLAPVGEQFLKALTPIVEFVGKVLEKFNGLGDGSKKFLTIMTVVLGAVGPLALMTFGLLANGVANIIKLFATLRSGFNKFGSSTNTLGQQTDYLSQQQVEASAIAASLDQVHQRLKQTFTSETSAVNALALAYRNAISAQLGFTGPVGRAGKMKGPPQSSKFATGVTRVPGRGNEDTVPAMLTPGEAVIPAGAAQDPANKPIIARMVAGQKVQGFNTGTTFVTFDGQEYNTKTARKAKSVKDFLAQLIYNQDGTLTDSKTGKTFTRDRLSDVMRYRSQEGKELSASQIRRSIQRKNASNKSPLIRRLTQEYEAKNAKVILEEKEALQKALKDRGLPPLTASQADDAFKTKKAHLTKDVVDGVKRWRVVNVAPDAGYINQYMNTVEGDLGKNLLKLSDAELGKIGGPPGINRDHLKGFVDGKHPVNAAQLDTFRRIAQHDIALDKSRRVKKDKLYQAHLVDAGLEWRAKEGVGGYSEKGLRSFADLNPSDKQVILERSAEADPRNRFSQQDQRRLKEIADRTAQTKSAQLAPTNFGKLVAPTTGYSFDVPGVGGLYEGPNGKTFVKPMMSELDALAEKRATDFAREVHGLDTPEQKISTMIDPSDPEGKRKIIVLESKYNENFNEKKIPKTFTRDQYFKQLVASAVRGDKDLKMGNLGGNRLTDVGTAGVFDRATSTGKKGIRELAKNMPSMYEMAERNLQGVTGSQAKNSPNWFANETQKNINKPNYTADKYDADMKKEIRRIQANTEAFVQKIPVGDPLRGAYLDLLRRVNEGAAVKDWRPLYDKHMSIAVKPNEVVVDEDGNIKKPKTQRRKSGTKTKSTKDTRTMRKEKAQSVRQVTRIPGKSDAETILHPSVQRKLEREAAEAQAKAARDEANRPRAQANALSTYGTVAPTASQRSIRRKNERLQTQGKPLIGLTKELAAPVSVFRKVLDRATESVKKQTVASKALEKVRVLNQKKADKAASKSAKATGSAKPRMNLGGAAMGVSGVAMMGSMIPGAVGEMFQKLMMPLMGLSMIIPMLGSVTGALTVAALAAVGAIIKLRMEFDKAQNEAIKLEKTMGSGKDAMRDYSKFAGTVTAGEIMERRSKEKFNLLGAKTGKTTFGESFVQSKGGKELLASTNSKLKSGDAKGATADLTNQLMSSVLSGALTGDQAKSIALNLGKQIGNYGLGFAVTANINEIIGPNGENLTKDPLKIRVDLINAKAKQSGDVFNQMQGNSGFLNGAGLFGAINPNVNVAGQAAAGAGIGAGTGAAIGGTIGSIVPGPGTAAGAALGAIIGTGIGGTLGAFTGYKSSQKANEKAAGMSGAVVASQVGQLEQQQEMVDSLDLYYQKKLKELEVEGNITKMKEEQGKYDDARLALVEKGAEISKTIMANYGSTKGNVRTAMDTGIDKMLTQRYEGTDEVQYLDAAKMLVKDSGLTAEQQYLIKVKMSTGELTPSQQVFLFSNFGDNKEVKQQYMDIITRFSARTSDETTRVMSMFTNPDGSPNTKIQTEFIAKVSKAKTDEEASKLVGFFAEVANTNGVFDMTASLNYYMANPKVAEKTQGIIDNIEKNKGNLELNVMTNFLPENVMGAIDSAYFEKLSQPERLTYLKEIATIVNIPDPVIQADPEFLKWQKDGALYNGLSYTGKPIGEQIAAYRQFQPWKTTQESIAQAAAVAKTNTSGTGTKVQSSPLDDLVKKLRDLRQNQIKVTEGWSASRKVLDNLFGGKKTIDVFSGIENDLRGLGASENMIELIVGMDPKEYEKKKNSLFKFDNKGNIIGLKRDAQNIQEALNSITMGQWNTDMESQLKTIENQSLAFDKLAKVGVPVADAYELISDKALAAAIANGTNEKTLNTLIGKYKVLKVVAEGAAAVQDVKTDAAQFKKDRVQENRLKNKMSGSGRGLSELEAFAIKSDDNLAALDNSIASQKSALAKLRTKKLTKNYTKDMREAAIEKAQDALDDAEANFEARLSQLKSTIGLYEDVFNEVYDKGLEMFDVKEQSFKVQFDINTDQLNKDIEKAQNEIADKQYLIDDKEAALKAIEDQEQKINDKYDERIEALDEVEKANAAINQQQKGQLTLAEALTSGDIAAAARAAQEMRAQAAADAVVKQRDAIEKARKNELEGATGFDKQGKTDPKLGKFKTRKQLEEEIKGLQDEIFKAEEDTIEPKQDKIRLAEIELKAQIDGIKVADMTRLQWEQIRSQIDMARIGVAGYEDSLKESLKYSEDLIKLYKGETLLPKYQEPVYNSSDDPEPDPNPKPDPKPDPSPCPAGMVMGLNGKCIPKPSYADADKDGTPDVIQAPDPKPCPPGMKMNGEGKCVRDTNIFPDLFPKPDPKPIVPSFKDDDKNGIPDNIQAPPKVMIPVPGTGIPGTGSVAKAFPPLMMPKAVVPAPKDLDKNGIPDNIQAPKVAVPSFKDVDKNGIPDNIQAPATKKKTLVPGTGMYSGGTFIPPRYEYKAKGGIIPKMFSVGGFAKGTDVVPAMLTPGEFIMSKYAVDSYGVDNMRKINNGDSVGGAVYNNTYALTVNAKTNANPNEIAQAVMSTIKQVDDRRIRGINLNGR